MHDISIVFPVFNKQNSVRAVYDVTKDTVSTIIGTENYELIFVDDASTDASATVLEALAAADKRVRLLRHQTNRGQVRSLETGLRACRGNVVFFATCDLQNPLESIAPIYMAMMEGGHDLGVAYRERHLDRSWQSLLSRMFFYFLRLLFPKLPKGGFDYGAMHHSVSDRLKELDFEKVLIQLEVFRYARNPFFYPIERNGDRLDHSGWTTRQKVSYAFRFIRYLDGRAWTRALLMLAVPVAFVLLVCIYLFR